MTRKNTNTTNTNETKPTKEVNTMTTKKKNTKSTNTNATQSTQEVTPMTTNTSRPKKSSKKSNASAGIVTAPAITAVATIPAVIAATPVSPPTSLSSADAAQCQSLLSQISGILGSVTELSASDIRRSIKLRKGGAQVIPQLVDLCTQHGITSVGPVTTDGLTAQKARADTLNTIGVNFDAVHKKLNDATFSTESDAWQQAMALYTVLQRLAVFNPTLAQGIEPVQAFFQTKATKGTVRAKTAKRNAVAANKMLEKYESSTPSPAATPASSSPAVASASSSPAVSNEASVPAPVAVTPAGTTNGVAHS